VDDRREENFLIFGRDAHFIRGTGLGDVTSPNARGPAELDLSTSADNGMRTIRTQVREREAHRQAESGQNAPLFENHPAYRWADRSGRSSATPKCFLGPVKSPNTSAHGEGLIGGNLTLTQWQSLCEAVVDSRRFEALYV